MSYSKQRDSNGRPEQRTLSSTALQSYFQYDITLFVHQKGDESDDLLANEDEDDPLEISGKSSAGTGIPGLPLALAENSSLTDPNGEDNDDDSDGWSNGQPYGRVSHGDNR